MNALATRQIRFPDYGTLHHLHLLVVEAEKRLTAGPWDEWDQKVLEDWLDSAREQFTRALAELSNRAALAAGLREIPDFYARVRAIPDDRLKNWFERLCEADNAATIPEADVVRRALFELINL